MTEWADRLKAWMEAADLRVPELAKRSGVSEESLYKYLRGRTAAPRGDAVSKIAAVFSKTAPELLFGENILKTKRLFKVPYLPLANVPDLYSLKIELAKWQGDTIAVPYAVEGSEVFAVSVNDAACAPSVNKGDIVVVDLGVEPQPGDYVVAFVPNLGVAVLRRYRQLDAIDRQSFALVSDNQDFPSIATSEGNVVELIGRAVGLFKHL